MDKARLYALETINSVFNKREYSQIAINNTLKNVNDLDPRSEALYTQLVYGVLENKLLLDHYLLPYTKGKNLKQVTRHLLEMSIYQLVFLERIPEYAVTSDAVSIAKLVENEGVGRLVNGILRSFDKNNLAPIAPKNENVKYSMNEWLFKQIKGQYPNDYEEILKAFSKRNSNTARVNTLKTTREKIIANNPNVIKSKVVDSAVIYKRGNIAKTKEFERGLVSIQDEASQLVAKFLNPSPSDKVLDMCAAPGGKTCHMAEIMKNNGKIIANDVHPHKIKLIEENLTRLGIKNVETTCNDATKLRKIYFNGEFDKVLLDAPCSGWGVIKRKPEIRYFTNEKDVDDIILLQKELLEQASYLVKVDGILVYSTCTINRGENDVQVKQFLKNHPNFVLEDEKLVLPNEMNTDGFFMARFKRVAR